jgi:hypothetical protein
MMAQENKAVVQPARPASFTLRLTFAYDANGIRLIRSQRVEMITPPSVTPPPQENQAGYWFEVRDANGRLLYYRVLHDPLQMDLEIFSNDPKQPITRVPNSNPNREFTLLVPDLPEADSFVFRGELPGPKGPFAPPQELARYSFDQLRRFPGEKPR